MTSRPPAVPPRAMLALIAGVLLTACEPKGLLVQECETRMAMAQTRADSLAVFDTRPGIRGQPSDSWYPCAAFLEPPHAR